MLLFFLFDYGREDPNTTISGPASADRHLNDISLAIGLVAL